MSMVITGVSMAAITIGSAYVQSQNAKKQARANYDLALINGEMADLDAAEARRNGMENESRAIGQTDQFRDAQTAALSASGAENFGTVKSLINESNLNASLNLIDLQEQTFLNELKFKREAATTRAQGKLNRAAGMTQADNIMLSGYANAAQIGVNTYYNRKK